MNPAREKGLSFATDSSAKTEGESPSGKEDPGNQPSVRKGGF